MLSVSLQSSSYQMSQWQSSTSEGRQMLGSMSEQSQSYTRVESNDPEFVVGRAESPFDLVQRALARAYEKLASDIELPQTQSGAIGEFEPLTAERVAGNILGFIERRLTLDEAEGATAEQLESRLEAGLKGFKQGFAEAQEQLEALGMLNETVANDIGQTYDLVISGVESLREQFLGTPPNVDTEPRKDDVEELIDSPAKALGMRDAGAVSSSAYDFAQKNTFSFTLVTADGDKVKISASASEAFVSRYAESAEGREYGAAYSANQHFSLSVKGELDEDGDFPFKFRLKENICANANSAVVVAFASGVFITMTSFFFAEIKSILSTPAPALPIIFNLVPAEIIKSVAFVAERTTKPS